MWWHNLVLIGGVLVQALPGLLVLVSTVVSVCLVFAVLVWLEGEELRARTWAVLILAGPVGLVATLLLAPQNAVLVWRIDYLPI